MLVPAPYQAPEKKAKKKAKGTRGGLRNKGTSYVTSEDTETHSSAVGYGVPAKPLRFELWGAHEDLLPTDPRPQIPVANLSYTMNNTRDTRFILVRATVVV